MTNGEPGKSDLDKASDDLSEEERRDFGRQLDELQRDVEAIEGTTDTQLDVRLRELAGGELEAMLASQEHTMQYLTNSSPKLRQASLSVAEWHWKATNVLSPICEKMALADPDEDVRETAVRVLGTCYARSKDRRVGRLLAGISRNEECGVSLRLTAFASLRRLHGLLEYTGKAPSVPLALEHIDWPFVDEYLSLPKTPSGETDGENG